MFRKQGSTVGDGRYVLDRRIGAGGMATVWLATDTRLRRRVAIKLPSDVVSHDDVFLRRFEREAQTAASLSHPNLVPVHDYGVEEEGPFLVSEYIDGANLSALRERGEAPDTAELAAALLSALEHIHEAGILHRDIKPGNVLVERRGRILLTDFGISMPSATATNLTQTGHVVGTLDYMAPEVKRGVRASETADLYSCGLLLSEQLTANDPEALHELVDRLRSESPEGRPPTAEHALGMLDEDTEMATATGAEKPTATASVAPLDRTPQQRAPESVLGRSGEAGPPGPPRSTHSAGGSGRHLRWALGATLLVGVAVAVGALALAGSDEGEGNAQRDSSAQQRQRPQTSVSTQTETTTATETATTPEPPAGDAPSGQAGADSAQAVALNDRGYGLLQQGKPEEALPVLQQSVAAFPSDSTELNYAFALYNYAQALIQTGRPAEAIPLLEKRLSFSDNQRDVVEKTLADAREKSG